MRPVLLAPSRLVNWLEGIDGRRAVGIFALWAFWLTCLNFMGPLAYVPINDNADGTIPFRISASFHPSLWYPFQASGVDLLAQGMFDDIDVLLFLALPPWLAAAIVLFLQRFIAGVFTFRLLRDDLGVRPVVALLGALEFGALMVGFEQHSNGLSVTSLFSLPLLPAVLWLLPRIAASGRWSCLLAICLGILVAVSTTFVLQVFLVPLFAAWFWLAARMRSREFWAFLAVFLAAYLAAELPAILISGLNAVDSHRVGRSGYYLPDVRDRLSLLLDWMWGFPIQIALTIVGAACVLRGAGPAHAKMHRRVFVVALGYLCILKIFYVLYPLIWQYAWQHLPVIRGFQIERLVYVESFLLTVTACLALELLAPYLQAPRAHVKNLSVECLANVAIGVVLAHSLILQGISLAWQFSGRAGGFNFTSLYADRNLLTLAAMTKDDPPFRVEGTGHVHTAMLAAYGFESAGGYLNVYPKRYQDFWTQVIRPLSQRDPKSYRYFTQWGNRIYLFGPPFNLALLSLANVRFIVSSDPLDMPGLDLLQWIGPAVDRERRFRETERSQRLFSYFKGTSPGIAPYIYENKRYLPRVFSVGAVRAFDSPEAILEGLNVAAPETLLSSVYLEQPDAAAVSNMGTLGTGRVRLVDRRNDEWIVVISGEHPSVLVVTNSFSPFWRAYVGEVPTKVLPAYRAFQAVPVPAGTHRVTLRYEPHYRRFMERAPRNPGGHGAGVNRDELQSGHRLDGDSLSHSVRRET